MKVLILNGSHRPSGNTWRFSRFAEEVLKEQNHEVKIIDLEASNVKLCCGCLTCEESGKCIFDDDLSEKIVPAIEEADLIIFASPVYFDMPTTLMKNFIDRSNSLCGYFAENKKQVACFLVGQADEGSLSFAYECYKEYFMIMDLPIAGEPIMRIARDPEELVLDDQLKEEILKWVK